MVKSVVKITRDTRSTLRCPKYKQLIKVGWPLVYSIYDNQGKIYTFFVLRFVKSLNDSTVSVITF